MNDPIRQIYVILNPIAGHSDVDDVRQAVEDLCNRQNWEFEIYETTGEENVADVARKAVREGANLVVAAGGDGTVAGVVNGLVNTGVPLGIIPVGTGNGLARAMNIPLVLDDVMQLFSGDFIIEDVDTLQVGDQHFVLNVSTGISSRAMLKTEPEDKKRFGVLAYAQTILKDVMDTQPVIFNLDLDEHQLRVQGTEVLVSNGVMAQEPAYFFGKRHEFSDGKLEVNILTASETPQFIRLIWDLLLDPREPKEDLHDLTVKKYIRLDVEDGPQPVQADGELIGETPVEITIAPKSIRILVPKEEEQQSKEEKEQKEKEIGQAS